MGSGGLAHAPSTCFLPGHHFERDQGIRKSPCAINRDLRGIGPLLDTEWYLPDLHMMCHPTRRERRRERLYHRHARSVTAGRMKMIAGTWLARARDNILRRDQHALGMAIWTYWGACPAPNAASSVIWTSYNEVPAQLGSRTLISVWVALS